MAKSSKSKRQNKPKKPYRDFPLFPHATGRWAKKIRGKLHYFGKWHDAQGALERFNREWPYLSKGRTPPPVDNNDGLTVLDLCNRFLTHKRHLLDTREISHRTFGDCYKTCEIILGAFDKNRLVDDLASHDFGELRAELAKTRSLASLADVIGRIRSVFKFAVDSQLVEHLPRYGPSFNKPSRRVLRAERQRHGPKVFEKRELWEILNTATIPLKAMILLGLNAGLGNRDVALLPLEAVDMHAGWLDYPRPKTATPRRCPLWPETVQALRESLAMRPEPMSDDDAGLFFLTRRGVCWVEQSNGERKAWKDSVGLEFGKLLRRLDMKRRGVNFYTLRRVFRTVADESRDQPAVDFIMGHTPNVTDMAAVYRQRISNERLQAVVDYVHDWLFSSSEELDDAGRLAAGSVT